jgi:hypothetical protein
MTVPISDGPRRRQIHCLGKASSPSLRRCVLVVTLALLATSLSGCEVLMLASLGSLGYEGYEYEKTGQLPGMPSQSVIRSKPDSQSSRTGDDIE